MVQIYFEINWIRFIIGIELYQFLVELELIYYWYMNQWNWIIINKWATGIELLNGSNWRIIKLDIALLVYLFGKHIYNTLHQKQTCTRFITKQIYVHNTKYTKSYTVDIQSTYNHTRLVSFIFNCIFDTTHYHQAAWGILSSRLYEESINKQSNSEWVLVLKETTTTSNVTIKVGRVGGVGSEDSDLVG